MAASGTFGPEYGELVDIRRLGAIVAKTITLKPRQGNSPPRLVETASGMINSIGLENPGLEIFIKEKLPALLKFKIPIIASISADNTVEFEEMANRLDKTGISGIELNLSCPNIKSQGHLPVGRAGKVTSHKSGLLVAQNGKTTYDVVKAVRKTTKKTLIAKLTPNVTDITGIAKAAEDAGSDAVSLVNTFMAMAVDIETRTPKLGNVTGGLSGPAIKPMALKMVWDVFNKVNIPIIGIGGILSYKDALEFIICGAAAVQVGTANFVNPGTVVEVIEGVEKYLKKNKIDDLKKIVGSLKVYENKGI
jgi:dihydroorotate dehydrogenase (NAD+) catalytic subunit